MFQKEKLNYAPIPLPHRSKMNDGEIQAAAEAFLSKMSRRHTVRDYTSRPVDQAVIASYIETAGPAPSGANHQPWHFVAISDAAAKNKFVGPPKRRRAGFMLAAQGMNGSRRSSS